MTIVKNTCDPFAMVSVEQPSPKKDRSSSTPLQFKTRVWKKTTSPRFDEVFYFPDAQVDYSTAEIRISVWHESASAWGHVFLGEIRVPLQSLDGSPKHKAW